MSTAFADSLFTRSFMIAPGAMLDNNLWIVIPAFQEAMQVEHTIHDLARYLPYVLVVDDGSVDKTADAAASAGARVIRHAVNLGQGAALQTGIDYALANGATLICTFDADGQHEAETINRMLLKQGESGADVILASRFTGNALNIPFFRRFVLLLAVRLTRIITRLPVTDTHNGLRLFTRAAALQIKMRQPGMAHASEFISIVAKLSLKMAEVPSTMRYTAYSRAKGQRLSNSVKIALDLAYAALSK